VSFKVNSVLRLCKLLKSNIFSYTILWPTRDFHTGGECTRDFLFGIGEGKQLSGSLVPHTTKLFFLNNGPHTTELLHSGKFNHTSGLSRAFARHLKRMCMLKKVRGFYMELVYNPGRCCGFFNILCRVIFLNN
jgi:hypothetical protein